MSFHTDYAKWLKKSDPQHCPVCRAAPMPDGMEDIVELPHSWLDAVPEDCLYGACSLVAKRHVLELYELDDADLLALMKEVALCAQAIKNVTQAVKINYEIHGNTIPHLHVHLYPRYLDDPFPNRSIDYHQKQDQYGGPQGFAGFVAALRAEIAALRAADPSQ